MKRSSKRSEYLTWASRQKWYAAYRDTLPETLRSAATEAATVKRDVAAYRAVQSHLGTWFRPDDPSVVCVVPGCGRYPHTAAMLALTTNWQVHAIDPDLTALEWGISNLHSYRTYVEFYRVEAPRVAIVAVGSHARLSACVGAVTAERLALVVLPCGCKRERRDLWLGPAASRAYCDREAEQDVLVWRSIPPDGPAMTYVRRRVDLARFVGSEAIDTVRQVASIVAYACGDVVGDFLEGLVTRIDCSNGHIVSKKDRGDKD